MVVDNNVSRSRVPNWAADVNGKAMQEKVWNDVSTHLSNIAPGCIERAFAK